MLTALGQLAQTSAPAPLTDAVCLSGFLDLVPDPRGVRGRRHRLTALVAAAAASVLAGARSLTAITEWITDAPSWACRALGFPVDPLTGTVPVPHPHTVRRLLVQLDGDAPDQAIGAFLTARATPSPAGLRAIAVDGKALRGSRTATTPHVTLLAAMDHTGLFDRVRHLPWREITLDHHERTRTHHRTEIRRLKTTAFAHLDYPDARQALQVVRWRKDFTTGKLTIERVYLITSLPPGVATGVATGAQLAAWIRGHWKIENLLHHVRDRTFREDDSKIHIGRLPRTMASLRNLAIGVHRQGDHTNIAAALRHTARDCRRPLTALGLTG